MKTLRHRLESVHIQKIRAGDTIVASDGKTRTVCNSAIDSGFCGVTLYGDSYRLGTLLVTRVLFPRFYAGGFVGYFAQ